MLLRILKINGIVDVGMWGGCVVGEIYHIYNHFNNMVYLEILKNIKNIMSQSIWSLNLLDQIYLLNDNSPFHKIELV